MDFEKYKKVISKNTTYKYDTSAIFNDFKLFQELINFFQKNLKNLDYDKIVALESSGFILGSALAIKEKKPFVAIRKKSKLPYKKSDLITSSFTDYSNTKKALELNKNSIKKQEKIVIVDDWIETGSQIKAAIKLVEKLQAKVVLILAIAAHKNDAIDKINSNYKIVSVRVLE